MEFRGQVNEENRQAPACTLVYPQHQFNPEDLLTFIEMKGFAEDWKGLQLNEDDLFALQIAIMSDPRAAPVIQGTGGLRKLRFAPSRWNVGKRDALRVCYVYFEEFGIVLLVIAYSKGDKDDLSADEKRSIKQLLERQKREFSRRTIR